MLHNTSKAETVASHFIHMAGNVRILTGIALFALALVAYSWVLGKMKLSVAYPVMTSMGFLIVITFSWLVFKEQLTAVQIAGACLIIIGVWMMAFQIG